LPPTGSLRTSGTSESSASASAVASEAIEHTRHPKIFIGRIARVPAEELTEALSSLRALVSSGSDEDVRWFLGSFLPEAQLNGAENQPELPLAAAAE
jgi:hypothetical protein